MILQGKKKIIIALLLVPEFLFGKEVFLFRKMH